MTSSLVTDYLSPAWVLAQCCLLALAFSIRVTIPASPLSWLSIPSHWPTKIYIHPSLSLMLPFNIGLPKTPHGFILDRCHEPCPSVIPNTDQPRPNTDLQVSTWCYHNTSPIKTLWVLTQCYPNTGLIKTTAFWSMSWGWNQGSFTRWQSPPILAQVGVSSNGTTLEWYGKLLGV